MKAEFPDRTAQMLKKALTNIMPETECAQRQNSQALARKQGSDPMDDISKLRMIENDLKNIFIRIESMRAHPDLTNAGQAVLDAEKHIVSAQASIHGEGMRG